MMKKPVAAIPAVNKYKAEWTGKYPWPYLGEWKLYKNGQDISFLIPTNLKTIPAFTYGEYPVWEERPFTNGAYVQQYATDGFRIPEWIEENRTWLSLMIDTEKDFKSIFDAFHKQDFRTSRYI